MSFAVRTLDNPTQLVLRHEHHLRDQKVLLAAIPNPDWVVMWPHACQGITPPDVFTTDYDVFSALQVHNAETPTTCGQLHYGSHYGGAHDYDLIILYARKSALETQFLIHMLLPALQPSGRLWLVGEKKAGIQSQSKHLQMAYTEVAKLDAARHCALYEASLIDRPPAFVLDDWVHTDTLDIQNQPFTLCSLPGVFSHRRLDTGSAVFLEALANIPLTGRILDFGCGAGVIGAWLALQAGESVDLVMLDNSALALEATRRTLASNGLSQCDVIGSDGWQNVTGTFDAIVSNPPFHRGIATCYEPTESLIRRSTDFLRSKGSLYLVANTFLPYQDIMQSSFVHHNTLSKRHGFTVYQGQKNSRKRR